MTYCSDCGRPLQEGEVCQCANQPAQNQSFTPPPAQPQQPPAQPQQSPIPPQQPPQPGYQQMPPQQPMYAPPSKPSALPGFFKSFFKTPGPSGMQVLHNGKTSDSIVLAVIYAALNALYIPILINRSFRWLFELAAYGNSPSITRDAYSYMEAEWKMLEFPVVQFAFSGLLFAAVLIFLLAVAWVLIGRTPTGKISFTPSLFGVSISTYAPSLSMAAAMVCLFFSIRLSLLFAAASLFLLLATSAGTLRDATAGHSQVHYLYGLLFFLALGIALFLLMTMLSSQFMNISATGVSLKSATGAKSLFDLFEMLIAESMPGMF